MLSSKFPARPPEAIIILGAAQYDGRPSGTLAARLDHALILTRSATAASPHRPPTLYTVGGKLPGDRFTEAEVSQAYLVQRLASPQSTPTPSSPNSPTIHAIPTGSDTKGSLRAVLAAHPGLVGQRVTIVTDPLHVLRTWLIARELGLKARVSPTRTCPHRFPKAAWWRYLAHEGGGLLVYAVTRLTNEHTGNRLRSALHHVEAVIRPSRKARHEKLRAHLSDQNI